MARFLVQATSATPRATPPWPDSAPVPVAPGLLARLGLTGSEPCRLRFGTREVETLLRPDPALAPDRILLPAAVAERLCLHGPQNLSVWIEGPRQIALGPLVGVLISRAKLQSVLAGRFDTVYSRYADYAREAGAVLFFFSDAGLDPERSTVQGYQLAGEPWQGWRWTGRRFPLPRVIYDRCFGREGRDEGRRVRELAASRQILVVNHPVKITKLQAFVALQNDRDLRPYLPFTTPLNPQSLAEAMATYQDLYLKPDALYKGQGIYRLIREGGGWLLQHREDWENASRPLGSWQEVVAALAQFLGPEAGYLVQEGLPLATYLGNRFDFRSLVQKDGQGEWVVTGLVARIAPCGSVITSPRSGGRIAPADQALAHCFPGRWESILAGLHRVSRLIAAGIDRHLGPCVELGLDLGVLSDGSIRLIEVNGKPLKVSLVRLWDPQVAERIYRYPIHAAASLDGQGG